MPQNADGAAVRSEDPCPTLFASCSIISVLVHVARGYVSKLTIHFATLQSKNDCVRESSNAEPAKKGLMGRNPSTIPKC